MSVRIKPPFRADHVGSFLRPRGVLDARRDPGVGPDELRAIEDAHILRVLAATGTREEASRVLGIDPSTLWRRLRRYETEG